MLCIPVIPFHSDKCLLRANRYVTHRDADTDIEKQTRKQRGRQAGRRAGGQAGRQASRQAGKLADTDRQTGSRHRHRH
eukprot:COSAG03_NODE_9285_length_732_cov_0.657188_1_plen_77_part_10